MTSSPATGATRRSRPSTRARRCARSSPTSASATPSSTSWLGLTAWLWVDVPAKAKKVKCAAAPAPGRSTGASVLYHGRHAAPHPGTRRRPTRPPAAATSLDHPSPPEDHDHDDPRAAAPAASRSSRAAVSPRALVICRCSPSAASSGPAHLGVQSASADAVVPSPGSPATSTSPRPRLRVRGRRPDARRRQRRAVVHRRRPGRRLRADAGAGTTRSTRPRRALDLDRRIARLHAERRRGRSSRSAGQANAELATVCTDRPRSPRRTQAVDRPLRAHDHRPRHRGRRPRRPAPSKRRAEAIAALQEQTRAGDGRLAVWLTLPVDPVGPHRRRHRRPSPMLAAGVDIARRQRHDDGLRRQPRRADAVDARGVHDRRPAVDPPPARHPLRSTAGIDLSDATLWRSSARPR